MKTLLVYDSSYGNTEAKALVIASELRKAGTVNLAMASKRAGLRGQAYDLVVVGGPTQPHGASPEIHRMLETILPGELEHCLGAAFDTRYHKARLLTASAAHVIANHLEREGARLVAPPESFFVTRTEGPLAPGESERAR